jgi:uncharacterized protein YbaR (Trm112 family)
MVSIRKMLETRKKTDKRGSKADEKEESKELSRSKEENHGFLVCKECNGYYELQGGESPEDFEQCECEGELKYVQNFDEHVFDELDPLAEINICQVCGAENSKDNKFCTECGEKIEL